MNKSAVICGIEYALRNEGCNEIPVAELYARVQKTRGNSDLSLHDFLAVLRELVVDGLFEFFGEGIELSEGSLIARSQMHPSVPYGKAIELGQGRGMARPVCIREPSAPRRSGRALRLPCRYLKHSPTLEA